MNAYNKLIKKLDLWAMELFDLAVKTKTNTNSALVKQAANAIKTLQSEVQKRENDCINLTGECATYYAQIPKWRPVDDPPEQKGEYIVAYYPCYWNNVDYSSLEVGIDTFLGKTSWAKRKYQRVTHWMYKPKPPKEDNQ